MKIATVLYALFILQIGLQICRFAAVVITDGLSWELLDIVNIAVWAGIALMWFRLYEKASRPVSVLPRWGRGETPQ